MAIENDQALGRAWKAKARTVVMESEIGDVIRPSEIGDVIRPEGWAVWDGIDFHQNCYYTEYNNRGPNGDPRLRAEWVKRHEPINKEASLFLNENWLGDVTWPRDAREKFIDSFVKS